MRSQDTTIEPGPRETYRQTKHDFLTPRWWPSPSLFLQHPRPPSTLQLANSLRWVGTGA